MSSRENAASEIVGPEPWRTDLLEDYCGPPPVPIDAVEREFRPENGWVVNHAVYFGSFNGEPGKIPVTVASHPRFGRYQWFPIRPDRSRRTPKPD
jgi:hypothetical protein